MTCAWWGRGGHALGGGGGDKEVRHAFGGGGGDMRLVGEGVTCVWWGRG